MIVYDANTHIVLSIHILDSNGTTTRDSSDAGVASTVPAAKAPPPPPPNEDENAEDDDRDDDEDEAEKEVAGRRLAFG